LSVGHVGLFAEQDLIDFQRRPPSLSGKGEGFCISAHAPRLNSG
jgi:hypothetical protein